MSKLKAHSRLLDLAEQLAKEGDTTPQDLAFAMSVFLVDLAFDCAPDKQQATHLILSAINERIEQDMLKAAAA
jgi:hypothetical protein